MLRAARGKGNSLKPATISTQSVMPHLGKTKILIILLLLK
jgi:hypothetical protein